MFQNTYLLDLAGWRYSLDVITDDDVLGLISRWKDLNFKPEFSGRPKTPSGTFMPVFAPQLLFVHVFR